MKIYFIDGYLDVKSNCPSNCDHVVDAANGYTYCSNALDWIYQNEPQSTVYTNSLIALSNDYTWNEELQVPEIYIKLYNAEDFIRVDKLTDREIRQPHNIMKMFMNGAFNLKEE